MMHRVLVRCMAVVVCAVSLCAYTSNGQLSTKQIVQDVGIDQHLDAQLPLDAVLVDEQGQSVRLAELFGRGKPVIVTFVYFRCPMLCTQVLNGLLRSSQAIKFTMHEDF